MKSKIITMNPWGWHGNLVVGGDPATFSKKLTRQLGLHEYGGSPKGLQGWTWLPQAQSWIIWVADLENIPVLAHEGLHMVSGILEVRGVSHTKESEEAYAYTLQDFMTQALEQKGWTNVEL